MWIVAIPHVNCSYAFISILFIVTKQDAKIFHSINSVVPLSLNSFTMAWFSKISVGAPNLKLGVHWEMNCDKGACDQVDKKKNFLICSKLFMHPQKHIGAASLCKQSENGTSCLCLLVPWVAFHRSRMVYPLSPLLHLFKFFLAVILLTCTIISLLLSLFTY